MILFKKKKTINIIFMNLLAHFIKQNFKKILRVDPELWGCTIFGPKMTHLPQMKIFSEKPLIVTSIYLLTPFIVQNLKKNT